MRLKDAIYLIGADSTDDNERPQTSLVIARSPASNSTLVCYLHRALATAPAGPSHGTNRSGPTPTASPRLVPRAD